MSEKLIIDNKTDKTMAEIMGHVAKVLEMGRVSDDDGYCYQTEFNDGVIVSARRNKASDTLVVWEPVR